MSLQNDVQTNQDHMPSSAENAFEGQMYHEKKILLIQEEPNQPCFHLLLETIF